MYYSVEDDEIPFFVIYCLYSVFVQATVIACTHFARRYNHIKSKDIPNLWIIVLSGIFHTWGLVLFNMPVYDTEEGPDACIVTG